MQAIIPVTAGTTLYAEVGNNSATDGGGGTSAYGAYGGGASDLQTCGSLCTYTAIPGTDSRLIVAGGGGGGGEGGHNSTGPAGGDAAGASGPGAGGNGTDANPSNAGGNGGLTNNNTTASVGAGSPACGVSTSGGVGSPGQGGAGGWRNGAESSGGGGGGGWVGGSGGGAGDCPFNSDSGTGGGGGAGASFAEASALDVSIALGGATPEVVITPVVPATVSVSSSNVSVVWGQSVTLTATVTGFGLANPTGTVDFKANGVDIAGCTAQAVAGTSNPTTATCTTTALPIGHPELDHSLLRR